MKPDGTGRVRDNIPAKMGAQTQRRESLTGEPPPSWGKQTGFCAAPAITEGLFLLSLPIELCLLLLLNDWLSFINRGRGDCRPLLFRQLQISLCRIDQKIII
jgi:hypothetical protein